MSSTPGRGSAITPALAIFTRPGNSSGKTLAANSPLMSQESRNSRASVATRAGAIASFAFDLPEPIVDANIARVLARLTNWEIPIDTSVGRAHLWQTATALLPTTRRARTQLRVDGPWRDDLSAAPAALRRMSGSLILPRPTPCDFAGQEKATGYRSPVGTARLHAAAQPRAPRAIPRTLARHVDSAPPARSATAPATPPARFSFHPSSHHTGSFRPIGTKAA